MSVDVTSLGSGQTSTDRLRTRQGAAVLAAPRAAAARAVAVAVLAVLAAATAVRYKSRTRHNLCAHSEHVPRAHVDRKHTLEGSH